MGVGPAKAPSEGARRPDDPHEPSTGMWGSSMSSSPATSSGSIDSAALGTPPPSGMDDRIRRATRRYDESRSPG